MSRCVRWSSTERGEPTRVGLTPLLGPVFLGALPFAVAWIGPRLDRSLGLPPMQLGSAGRMLGGILTAAGFSLGFWSVSTQLGRGRGTPLPVMPTQVLLTDGPFRYCRNPMTLGAIFAYLGIALVARTTTGMALVLAGSAALVTYLKTLEEPELTERFGDAYVAYKGKTPFMVPRLSKRD